MGIPSSDLCTDEVFLRRVYLDLIGTLPTTEESRRFLSSNSINKRAELIESLFERPEYADYWAMKWCDLLRVKAEFPSKLWPNAVQAYHRWVRTSLLNNMPYDAFARSLLTSSGSNFRGGTGQFLQGDAETGTRRNCPDCCAHLYGPPERTSGMRKKLYGMAAFFGQVGYKERPSGKKRSCSMIRLVRLFIRKPVSPWC